MKKRSARSGLSRFAAAALVLGSPCFGSTSWSETGAWFLGRGEYDRARSVFSRELETQAHNVDAVIHMTEVELLANGREAAHGLLLAFAKENWRNLSPESRHQLRSHSRRIQSLFLTDGAQTAFLQSRALLRNSNCTAVAASLRSAHWLEPDNLAIQELRLDCAQRTRDDASRVELLTEILALHPWDRHIREELILALTLTGDHEQAISTYEEAFENIQALYARTAYAAALVEMERDAEAIPLLREMLRTHARPPNIVFFALAKALSRSQMGSRTERSSLLRRFLSAFEPVGPNPRDSYRSVDKVPEARSLLSEVWSS